MGGSAVVARLGRAFARSGAGVTAAAMAMVVVSMLTGGVHGDESAAAKITISASPAASYFGERPVEGVMEFRGHKYLLTLRGISGPASSLASVFGLRRARDIVGPYTAAADGWRNSAGVTVRFDPPLAVREGSLRIELASRIYPKVSIGQGNDAE